MGEVGDRDGGESLCFETEREEKKNQVVSNQANGVCLKKSCINGHYRLTCLR